jgi:uncharacterized coiled-coil DUF342 family protein
MIFVCVSCGKKFLYRGDPASAPPCKACGGEIRAEETGAPAAASGGDARVRELEARISRLEADLKAKENELQETRNRLATVETDSQEAGAQIEALQNQLSEAEDRQERVGAEREREIGQARARIAQLEKELQTARSEVSSKLQTSVVRALKEKETELHEAQASVARLGDELKKAQDLYKEALTKRDQEAGEHAAAAAEAQASIARLGDELKKTQDLYKEALTRRDREAEEHAAATAEAQASIARLGEDLKKAQDAYKEALTRKDRELNEAHEKIAALEGGGAAAPAGEEQDRYQARIRQLEKNVLDADRRYAELEKRLLSAEVSAEGAPAKDETIAKLQAELTAARAEADELRRRIAVQEASKDRKMSDAEIRVGEARYLAADLDRSLESLATSLAGLVERVRRLIGSLHDSGPQVPQHVIPGSPAAVSETPASPEEVIEQARNVVLPAEGEAPPETPEEAPAPQDPPVQEPQAEAVPVLDNLPVPEAVPEGEGHLPTDDTILEFGGTRKAVNLPGPEETPPAQAAVESPVDAVPMTGAADEAVPAAEPAPEAAPEAQAAAAEDAPVPRKPSSAQWNRFRVPGATSPPPKKKKGFFGKLFGK